MIALTCPGCDSELEVADSKAGAKISCPECGERLAVPAPSRKKGPGPQAEPRGPAGRKSNGRRREEMDEDEVETAPRKPKTGLILAAAGGGIALVAILVAVGVFLMGGGKTEPTPQTPPNPMVASGPPPGVTPPAGYTPPRTPGAQAPTASPSAPETPKTEPPKQETPDDPPVAVAVAPPSTSEIYQHVLKSTVWIYTRTKEHLSSGSGTLIDRTNRWVLTSLHVVPDNPIDILIFFPIYQDNVLVTEKATYMSMLKKGELLHAKILAQDEKHDLALLEIQGRLPDNVDALPVARKRVEAGDKVISLGTPGNSSTLWQYTPGEVRQITTMKWKAGDGEGKSKDYESNVVLTSSPINPGDSGGPLVNFRGELIGVTHGANVLLKDQSLFIDVTEVEHLITEHCKAHSITWDRSARTVVAKGNASDINRLLKNLEKGSDRARAEAARDLGNLGPDARPAVRQLLRHLKTDKDELTRRACLEALEKIGPPDKLEVGILKSSLSDDNIEVKTYAAAALGKIGPEVRVTATPALIQATTDKDAGVRQNAMRSLGKMGGDAKDQVFDTLKAGLKDPDKEVRIAAAEAIFGLGTITIADLPTLEGMLKHQDMEVRAYGARAIGQLGSDAKPAIPALVEAFHRNPDRLTHRAVINALAPFGNDTRVLLPVYIAALGDADREVCQTACIAISKYGPDARGAVDALKTVLSRPDLLSRTRAATALSKIGPDAKDAVPYLADLLKEEDKPLLLEVLEALGNIGAPSKPAIPNMVLLLYQRDKELQSKLAITFGKIGKDAIRPVLGALESLDNSAARTGAAMALGEIGAPVARNKEAMRLLQLHVNLDPVPEVQQAARNALSRIVVKP